MLHPSPTTFTERMPTTAEQLEHAIATLQAQRALLGDAVLDLALAPLRAQLAVLRSAGAIQQLNLVSVLFLDVVGSTALAGRLDPEDIQAVMDGMLAALTQVVDQHGGRVLQYAGDSLLAAFGVDEVHEDDAERAVLCGLALLRQAGLQAARVQQQFGHAALNVRVGISSGSVLVGGGVDGENSIRGITVNMAARMEQSAPPGQLRISHDTWRLVRGLFEADEQPPLTVKGRDEPMLTYLVRGAVASPASAVRRGVDGVRVPMLGRDAELALLHSALDQVGSAGLISVTVVADAGLGKSRLAEEFGGWLAAQTAPARQLGAQAAERRRGRPYGLLRELLLNALGLVEGAVDPEDWCTALRAKLPERASAAVLGHLIGLDFAAEPEVHALRGDARALRDRAFFHALQWLADAAAGGAPLVVVLDDLQWADEGSLDFIEHLQRQAAEWPLLLVLLTRAGLFERRSAWASADTRHWRIDLAPLDAATCTGLAQALLQHLPELPEGLVQRLAAAADGNPYFAEELVNMLIDRGAIEVHGTRWVFVPQRLQALQLPATLVGVLQARLSALPPDRRRPLQLAAVAGAVFWDVAVAVLDEPARHALPDLSRRELIRAHDTSRLQQAREYEFRHHTLHRVAYESVLKRIKRSAHSALARWMAALPDAPSLQDQIAEHHERADEPLPARDAWHAAAEAARLRFANAEALAHAERALALTDDADLPRRCALTVLRLRVLEALAHRSRYEAAVDELYALADSSGDAGWQSEAAAWRARFLFAGGDATGALEAARRAVLLAPADDVLRGGNAHSRLFFVLTRLARYDEACGAAAQALALARRAGNEQIESGTLNELGTLAFGQGDIVAACEHWQQALEVHRRIGHLANEAGTRSNLAFAAMAVGDFAAAAEQFESARHLCERVGQQQHHGIVRINLGIVMLHLGQPREALAHAEQAIELLRLPGDRWAEAAALRVAGQAQQALGDAAAARERFVASRDLFDELKMPNLALEAIAALAAEALARGEVSEALHHAEQILERQQRGAGFEGADEPMRIPLAVWRALHAAGDARADGVLASARQELGQRAARLVDARQRESFLQAVAYHREILQGQG